jgi:hypothetical protein
MLKNIGFRVYPPKGKIIGVFFYISHHCCPRTVESIATSVDFIGLFAQNSTPSKPGFTAESRRSLRDIFSAPIGRRRLEQKLRPFANKIEPFYGYGTYGQPSSNRTETFLFVGISRQTKNYFSASSAALR